MYLNSTIKKYRTYGAYDNLTRYSIYHNEAPNGAERTINLSKKVKNLHKYFFYSDPRPKGHGN